LFIKALGPGQIAAKKTQLLKFIHDHGERRITRAAVQWLMQADARELCQPGTLILAAAQEGKLVGLCGVADYGNKAAFVVVDRRRRGRGIGQRLMSEQLKRLGKLSCNVAIDNLASIRMCFQAGLVAVRLFTGETGKPTLNLTGGDGRCLKQVWES
jgi:GNAT superfamily N-acetyltransferase